MLDKMIDTLAGNSALQTGDYIGEDGFLHCGVCHEAKEALLFPDGVELPNIPGFDRQKKRTRNCACDRERWAREDEENKKQQAREEIRRLREQGMIDAQYKDSRFANDDGLTPEVSRMCRQYVEQWERFRTANGCGVGLIFHGAPGGGKTFFASCIANALIEQCVPVIMDTIPRLSARMNYRFGESKASILNDLRTVPLLILDDFGIERDTEATLLNTYEIINERYKAKKQLIITTKRTLDKFRNEERVKYRRIYGRVSQMCQYPILVEDKQRRQREALKTYTEARNMFSEK